MDFRCALLLAVLLLTSCSLSRDHEKRCEALEQKVRQPAIQAELRNWVATRVVGKTFASKWETMMMATRHAGIFTIDSYFPWDKLGIQEPAWPTLVGPARVEDLDRPETFKSVYFGADNSLAVLVKLPGSSDYGMDHFEANLRPVAADIAVHSYQRED